MAHSCEQWPNPWWFTVFLGIYTIPSHIGIKINYGKGHYETISISWFMSAKGSTLPLLFCDVFVCEALSRPCVTVNTLQSWPVPPIPTSGKLPDDVAPFVTTFGYCRRWVFVVERIGWIGGFTRGTPWKINGWNLKITHGKKGKWSSIHLHEDMFHLNLPGCIL